jgi:hypothetical protein
MANTVDKVIKVASNEVGYLEKSAAAYRKDKDILWNKTAGAGSDNYTKYGYEMHKLYPSIMDFPAYWCDCFVDWCFNKAYGTSNAKALIGGDFNDYTVASAQLYKNKKAFHTNNPKVGDQIFFNNGSRICHTGLVVEVKGGYVYTIEGNTSGASGVVSNGGGVARKKYPINSARISGYGRPKYDKPKAEYFPKYAGKTDSIVMALAAINEKSDFGTRSNIALANGIKRYSGTADENIKLLNLLKKGKLVKP